MSRMRTLCVALAVSLLLAVAAPAPALLNPEHFNDLIVELNDREFSLPTTGLTKEQKKQKASIQRAFRALNKVTKKLTDDLVVARRMQAAVEKGFPGDPVLGPILDGMNDGFLAEIGGARDEVALAIYLAKEGKLRDRAQAKLDAADQFLAGAAAQPTQAGRALFHERCSKSLDKGSVLAGKAGPGGSTNSSSMYATVDGSLWQANSQFGAAVTGIADVSEARGNIRKVVLSGRRILPNGKDGRLPGDTTRLQITLLSNNADVLPGVYGIGTVDGVNGSATWYYELEDGTSGQAIATAGTIELTSATVHLGSVDVTGTFMLTMYDFFEDRSFAITGGVFDASGIIRESVP
jgi:hypothetical protein